MAVICLVFGIGCAIGAIVNRDDRPMLILLFLCAMLNFAAAADMFATQYEYAWRLAPAQDDADPAYHYRR